MRPDEKKLAEEMLGGTSPAPKKKAPAKKKRAPAKEEAPGPELALLRELEAACRGIRRARRRARILYDLDMLRNK